MDSPLTPLVRRAIEELRNYERTPAAKSWGSEWFETLRSRLERAISQRESREFEAEVHAVFHALADSGPASAEAAPSLNEVMDALQRRTKRVGKARP